MELYDNPLSPYAQKVRLSLYEKGLEFEKHEIYREGDGQALLAVSPRGEVPALRDGDTVVYDIAGRSVRTLLTDELPGGRHVYRWFGRNDAGALTAPGVYFVRLDSGPHHAVEKLVRLR